MKDDQVVMTSFDRDGRVHTPAVTPGSHHPFTMAKEWCGTTDPRSHAEVIEEEWRTAFGGEPRVLRRRHFHDFLDHLPPHEVPLAARIIEQVAEWRKEVEYDVRSRVTVTEFADPSWSASLLERQITAELLAKLHTAVHQAADQKKLPLSVKGSNDA